MPTMDLLPSTTIGDSGYNQDPTKTLDLDGYSEVALFIKAENLSGSTLQIEVFHSARNAASDRVSLATVNLTASGVTVSYQTAFGRYLATKSSFASGTGNSVDLEILAVPKRK